MNAEIRYGLAIFLRRLPLFGTVALAITVAAFTLAVSLPTLYASNAVLLVESAQIPDDLAASTVQTNAAEQLEIIEQRLMTRANLIEVARKWDVYNGIAQLSPDDLVRKMRDDTVFNSSSGKNRATLMHLEFRGRSPEISAGVLNEYVTRILDENVRLRTDQAEDTLEFFRQEVARLGTELSEYSAAIVAFQDENSDALPDSLEFRLTRQTTLQERKSLLTRDRALLEDQRARLVQIYETTGQIQAAANAPQTAEQRQLERTRDALAAAQVVYSETNPKVKLLRTQVTQLERTVASQQGGELPLDSDRVLEINLAEIDTRLLALKEETARIDAELVALEDTIARTPANQVALSALNRDYDNIQAQYSVAQDRLSKAATGERIELSAKGQRIAVLEQPTMPTEPTSPNRPLIAAGGTVLALGAALALVVGLELMDGSVRRPAQLVSALGITPLVSVPYMPTARQRARRRWRAGLVLGLVALGILGGIWMLHVHVAPLDLLMERITAPLGL